MTRKKVLKIALICSAVFFGLLSIVVLDTVIRTYLVNGKPLPPPDNKFVVANPINLKQIEGISKFRSCQGHDMSGKGENGVVESNRSMKHYFSPRDELREKLGVIEIFAPFDGEIVHRFGGKFGNEIMIAPDANPNWAVIIFHIELKDGLNTGKRVEAGNLIGYAHTQSRHDFDIGLTYTYGSQLLERFLQLTQGSPHFMLPKGNYMASIFDYMTDGVLGEFTSAGFDTADLKYSQEYRDARPCDFSEAGMSLDEWQYLPGLGPQTPEQQNQNIPKPDPSTQQGQGTPQPVLYP